MATTLDVPVGPKKEKAKRRSRRGNPSKAENIRFFVGKPCRNKEAPQLEREVASEAEGLGAAFKTDGSLFLLSEYTVRSQPRLRVNGFLPSTQVDVEGTHALRGTSLFGPSTSTTSKPGSGNTGRATQRNRAVSQKEA